MNPLDAFWHLMNFIAPAVFVGALSAAGAKLVWARELRGRSWLQLLGWAAVPAVLVAVAGLLVAGRDGRMTTYVAMVVAAAVGLWTRIPGRSG